MANIIKENTEIKVSEVYYLNTNKIAFYEKVIHYFVLYDDDSCSLTIIRQKISKKNFKKFQKTLDN